MSFSRTCWGSKYILLAPVVNVDPQAEALHEAARVQGKSLSLIWSVAWGLHKP